MKEGEVDGMPILPWNNEEKRMEAITIRSGAIISNIKK